MRDKAEVVEAIRFLECAHADAITEGNAMEAAFARVLIRAFRWAAKEPEGFDDDPQGSIANMVEAYRNMARARCQ